MATDYISVVDEYTGEDVGKAELRAQKTGLELQLRFDMPKLNECIIRANPSSDEVQSSPVFSIRIIDSVDTFHIGRQEFAFRIIPATPTIQIRGTEVSE